VPRCNLFQPGAPTANLRWSETAMGTKEYHKGRGSIAIDRVAREHSSGQADRWRDRCYSAPSTRCFDRGFRCITTADNLRALAPLGQSGGDLFENHDAGHDWGAWKMPGQARMIGRNYSGSFESHLLQAWSRRSSTLQLNLTKL